MALNPVDMIFRYKDVYDDNEPEAYETLLLDVMEGNATLFMRSDQVEAAWNIVMPILDAWQNRPPVDFPKLCAEFMGTGRCRSPDCQRRSSMDCIMSVQNI